jgi:hypothetical protein
MDHAIAIKLTENQYNVLRELARHEYRTMGNLFSMLAVHGLGFYLTDHDINVKKTEQDRTPNGNDYQYYTDQELEKIFETAPLRQ